MISPLILQYYGMYWQVNEMSCMVPRGIRKKSLCEVERVYIIILAAQAKWEVLYRKSGFLDDGILEFQNF